MDVLEVEAEAASEVAFFQTPVNEEFLEVLACATARLNLLSGDLKRQGSINTFPAVVLVLQLWRSLLTQ